MSKLVLSLTFAVGVASAATISTSATCDGMTTVGTTLAMCNDGRSAASAQVSPFSVSVEAGPLNVPSFLAPHRQVSPMMNCLQCLAEAVMDRSFRAF